MYCIPRISRLQALLVECRRISTVANSHHVASPAVNRSARHDDRADPRIAPHRLGNDAVKLDMLSQGTEVYKEQTARISVLNMQSVLDLHQLGSYSRNVEDAIERFLQVRDSVIHYTNGTLDLLEPMVHGSETEPSLPETKASLDGGFLDQMFGIAADLPPEDLACALSNPPLSFMSDRHHSSCCENAEMQSRTTTSGVHGLAKPVDIDITSDAVLRTELSAVARFHGSVPHSGKSAESGKSLRSNPKPNMDQLTSIKEHLVEYLPKVFLKKNDYRIYTKDLVFENNFIPKPYVTIGLNAYVVEVAKYRVYALLKYANLRITVERATCNEDDGSVCLHWRLSGIPQLRAFMFWKFLPWKYRSSVNEEGEFVDGISTYYVHGESGQIYKHRLDRVLPDGGKVKTEKENVMLKLGLKVTAGSAAA